MAQRETLTTEAGAPVTDNQHAQTAGAAGPVLLQDHHLIEKLARFNRERVPERVVHAVGSAAYGYLEVTSPDVPRWTKMALFSQVGKRTPAFLRFSTVAGSRGAADTARDPRGFALKVYSEEGNWDLVGNNTPVFFIRDGIKFPDFIHSQKPDPFTNRQEPDNVWDFFSHTPEATHQFTWLFGDRGIPASLRHMDGFGSHTYQWVNAAGERFWVKFHFKTDQGIRCLTTEEAQRLGGKDPTHLHKDLHDAIGAGQFPSWTVKVQVMPEREAADYRFNPFDLTKVWPYRDYPLVPIGRLVLDRLPDNHFAEVEQAAFDPGNFVPGIGPSPDRMLQARLFAYGDAHRYRLGINHTRLPVNEAKGRAGGARNYGRDGLMALGTNGGRSRNYEPNSHEGPAQTGERYDLGYPVTGSVAPFAPVRHRDDDDFVQAGALYRLISEDARQRLIDNLAGSLAQVSRPDVIERSIESFRKADPDYGQRLATAVAARRAP
jgi:catalase